MVLFQQLTQISTTNSSQ